MNHSPASRVAFAVHKHYLHEYIRPGERVLEIGAGAGRFTQVLAEITSDITVADISPGQLELNRTQSQSLGFASSITRWVECDACDLKDVFADQEFDTVIAYGGLLGYLFDQADIALAEFSRVTRPGGLVFLEVCSLWGTIHGALPEVLFDIPVDVNRKIISIGDLDKELGVSKHLMRLYRAAEFRRLLEDAGLAVEVISATQALSPHWDDELSQISEDGEDWKYLLEMELEACREPGCIDLGSHIIAVCRTPNERKS